MDATVNHSSAVPESDGGYAGQSGDAPSPSLAQIYEEHCASAIALMRRLADLVATPATASDQFEVLLDATRQDLDAIAHIHDLANGSPGNANGEDEAAQASTGPDDRDGEAGGGMAYIPAVHDTLIAAGRAAYTEGRKVLAASYEQHRLKGVGSLEMLAAQAQLTAATLKWDSEDLPSLVAGMSDIEKLASTAKLAIQARLQLAELDAQAETARASQKS